MVFGPILCMCLWKIHCQRGGRFPPGLSLSDYPYLSISVSKYPPTYSKLSYLYILTNSIILFYSILFYSIRFDSILFYSILFYSILFDSIRFDSILFYSILFFSIYPTLFKFHAYYISIDTSIYRKKLYSLRLLTSPPSQRTSSHMTARPRAC